MQKPKLVFIAIKKKKKIRKEVYVGFSGKALEKKRTKD